MNREIKFRGKSQKDGEWVFGHLIQHKPFLELKSYIKTENTGSPMQFVEIKPKTVGEFLGLIDVCEVAVCEGDILGIARKPELNREVYYEPTMGAFGVRFLDHEKRQWEVPYQPLTQEWINFCKVAVIGNIHDNPELLEAQ